MFHDLDDAEALLNQTQANRTLPNATTTPLNTHQIGGEVMNFTAFSTGIINGGGSKVLAVEVVGGKDFILFFFLIVQCMLFYLTAVCVYCDALHLSVLYYIIYLYLLFFPFFCLLCHIMSLLLYSYHVLRHLYLLYTSLHPLLLSSLFCPAISCHVMSCYVLSYPILPSQVHFCHARYTPYTLYT